MVASLTAKALRNAHRFESAIRAQQDVSGAQRKADLRRIALIDFMRRLLDRHTKSPNQAASEGALSHASDDELERLVSVATQVLDEEAKG